MTIFFSVWCEKETLKAFDSNAFVTRWKHVYMKCYLIFAHCFSALYPTELKAKLREAKKLINECNAL